MSTFYVFYSAYPKHVGKRAAELAWDKAIKRGADPVAIIAGAQRYANDPERRRSDQQYTAQPATWLNQDRWLDEKAELPIELMPQDLTVPRWSGGGISFAAFLKDDEEARARVLTIGAKHAADKDKKLNPIPSALALILESGL